MRFLTLGLLGAFFLAGLSGCIFSPEKGKTGKVGQTIPYVIPATPQAVLHNLKLAYENRDSVGYRKLFSLDYEGSSYDADSIGGLQPGTFTWLDEVHHIQAIVENREILRISLNLGVEDTWVRTSAYGPQSQPWAGITIQGPNLEIDFANDGLLLRAGETFDFAFAPEAPAPTSPTDTLWTIGRWTEIGPPGP